METKMEEAEARAPVIIVGAGPSGIATSACLNRLSVPHVLLERENCLASLWKKKSYDRLHLHLGKKFCQLPHMSFPDDYPKYVPRELFLRYLDDYVSHFKVNPLYNRFVESATYDEVSQRWCVKARSMGLDQSEEYVARFLVVATGETCDPYVPEVEGLESFSGEVLPSTMYKSGEKFRNKSVLVVGCGNSGMEIALDLSNFGANTSIVVRGPIHVLNRELMDVSMFLFKYLSLNMVDRLVVLLSRLIYGDMSKYGIVRPEEGPFCRKIKYRKFPVVDLGTCSKIKSGQIQVLPSITRATGNSVDFTNGKTHPFDAILFVTGFKRSTNKCLKDDDNLIDEGGFPKPSFPQHWKGRNGLYCVGLASKGLYGAAMDAVNIASDIKSLL